MEVISCREPELTVQRHRMKTREDKSEIAIDVALRTCMVQGISKGIFILVRVSTARILEK